MFVIHFMRSVTRVTQSISASPGVPADTLCKQSLPSHAPRLKPTDFILSADNASQPGLQLLHLLVVLLLHRLHLLVDVRNLLLLPTYLRLDLVDLLLHVRAHATLPALPLLLQRVDLLSNLVVPQALLRDLSLQLLYRLLLLRERLGRVLRDRLLKLLRQVCDVVVGLLPLELHAHQLEVEHLRLLLELGDHGGTVGVDEARDFGLALSDLSYKLRLQHAPLLEKVLLLALQASDVVGREGLAGRALLEEGFAVADGEVSEVCYAGLGRREEKNKQFKTVSGIFRQWQVRMR